MAELIRAVYEHGRPRPLDPVGLTDGQEIRLTVVSEREQVRLALVDLLMPLAKESAGPLDESAMLAQLDADLRGRVAVSDAILEERREGP